MEINKNMEPFIVNKIIYPFTRLVDNNGSYHESISIKTSLELARQAGKDLVCFNKPEKNQLALCKIINYGKWKYQHDKALKKEKLHKKETKEVRFSYNIDPHDIEHKIKQIVEFLDEGNDVVLTMKLMGRDNRFMKEAKERMNNIALKCSNNGKILSQKEAGSQIIIRLGK